MTVDGTPLVVHGQVAAPVRFEGHTGDVTLVVAEGLTVEAILGLDFLESNQCILDLRNRTLSLGNSAVLPLTPDKHSPAASLAVATTGTVHIPPTCELEIVGQVSGPCPGRTYLLEQAPHKRLPVSMARALVTR